MPYPSRSAFSANNFVDHFTGSSLNARWTSVVSGTGSVSVTDSYADLNAPANSASFIYLNTKIDITKRLLLMACVDFVTPGTAGFSAPFIALVNGASAPAADTHTNIGAKLLVKLDYIANSPDAIGPLYVNNSGTQTYWNDATPAWTTTYPGGDWKSSSPIRANDYYVVGIEIDGVNALWRTLTWGQTYSGGYTFNQGLRLFHLSDWVTWANTRDSSTGVWLVIGTPFNDDGNAHESRVEWVRYAEAPSNVVMDAWFDISSTRGPAGSKAQTQHHYSHDGYIFVPEDRTTLALSLGGSTYDDLDISPTSMAFDGASTDYCAYQSAGSVTASSINFASAAHASPQNGPWTKSASNPVITLGANETIVGFPILIPTPLDSDPNKKWKMLFSVKSSIDSKWRLHLATSPGPPTTGAWTRQGMVLDVGAGGSFDEKAARDAIPVYENGQWVFWYEGWDASGFATIGRATASDDWLTVTKDGSGKRIGYAASGDTTLTANLTGRTVTVTSTTGYVVDAWVLLCQANTGNDYSISRVRKVLSSTQLELYHGLDGFTTTLPCRITTFEAVPYWTPKVVIRVGSEWWFYINPWGTFLTYDGASYAAYRNQLVGLWTHASALSSDATPALDQLSMSVAASGNFNNDSETVENITLLNMPFTGDEVSSRYSIPLRTKHRLPL